MKSPLTNQQTAYIQNRYIYERRLISDILDISDKLSINGSLVTGDIEKTFDSLNHGFLLLVSKTFCFSNNFTEQIKILLTNQEYCVISDDSATSYFELKKGHVKMTHFLLIYL